MENKKIQDFKDLKAWQEGHRLAILVYEITENFPHKEMYSLVDQMRRAVVSVTSNIAEGFGRHSYKEKANFYKIAQGSLAELENQTLLAKDIGYIDTTLFNNFEVQLKTTQKLLGGLISKTKSFFSPSSHSNLKSPVSNLSSKPSSNSNLHSLISILFLVSSLYSLFSPHPADAFTLSKSQNNLLGLVGHWTFDGKDMYQNVADTSGNGNNGSLKLGSTGNISTTTSSGKIGQGLVFDGMADDYVIIPHTVIDGKTNVSYFFWYKTANNGSQAVISGANSGNDNEVLVFFGTNTRLDFYTGTGAAHLFAWTIPALSNSGWHHFGVVRDQDNSVVRAYRDGELISPGDRATTTTALSIDSGGLLFGQEQDTVGGGFGATQSLDGTLDDVRIYNRALSATEIRQLYNQGAGTKQNVTINPLTQGLVGHWTFDGKDMPSGKATDLSGNGNSGSPANISTSTFYTLGKIGQALKFDGVDDAISAGDIAAIDSASELTIAFWVYLRSFDTIDDLVTKYDSVASEGPRLWVTTSQTCVVSETNAFLLQTWEGLGDTGSQCAISDTNTAQLNKWTHVVATIRTGSSDGINLYINGVKDVNSPRDLSTISNIDSTTANFIIAGISSSYGSCKCSMDDVRVYSRALSASEIRQLYNLGAGTKVNVTPKDPLKSGLVGWWTFDGKDMPNGRVNDVSGNGNHGNFMSSFSTSTGYVMGKIGQAVNFQGLVTNNGITIAGAGVNVGASYTFATWVNWRDCSVGGYCVLMESKTGSDPGWYIRKNVGGLQSFYTGAGGDHNSATAVPPNSWHHVAVVNNAGTVNFYMDGVQDANSYTSQPAGVFGCIGSNTHSSCYGVSDYANASFDDFRAYNRALSASEIKQLYNMGR